MPDIWIGRQTIGKLLQLGQGCHKTSWHDKNELHTIAFKLQIKKHTKTVCVYKLVERQLLGAVFLSGFIMYAIFFDSYNVVHKQEYTCKYAVQLRVVITL